MQMFNKLIILICLIVFSSSGCVLLTKSEQLLTLKRYGDSQDEIQRYVDRQNKLFNKLLDDLDTGKLQPGISKTIFIRRYGDPVISRESDDPSIEEVLLYRHPTNYFSSDKVYAYFDKSGKLVRWEYKPYKENNG